MLLSEPRQILLIVALLAIMGLGAALGWRQRTGTVILALASIVWIIVDTSFEGATLLAFTPSHGLTSTDLVGLAGLVVAALEFWRLSRR